MTEPAVKQKRGSWLQRLTPEERRELGRKGGKASQAKHPENRFKDGSDWAKEAGRKGGYAKKENQAKGA